MAIRGDHLLERRGAAAIVFGLFVAGGIVFVFAGALAHATELEQQAALDRAEVAALEERRLAGRAEIEFQNTNAFVLQEARAIGWGRKDEQAFRLPVDAPSPEPVAALGSADAEAAAASPLEAWMELFFGD